ncbi:MAG TPA: hypothetical protein PK636_03025, partial [bacterium]|nr:hypothetical protein [bacterium]
NRQGRLKTGPALLLPGGENIYALGDCADFAFRGSSLRMSVQFSLAEAERAAGNLRRQIAGKTPAAFHPRDPGFIVPLATGRGWGRVLGVKAGGRTGSLLHYLLCVLRTPAAGNRFKLLAEVARALISNPGTGREQMNLPRGKNGE